MKYGSTFSGIGGFDLAFDQAGMSLAWQVEIDGKCRDLLERHWPGVERHSDIKEAHDLPGVDLIAGGFPCQDLSVAGRRAGLAGERSGLFYEFARLVEEQSPRWVVLENVPGLLSSNGGRDMGAVLGTLGELGYGFAYRVLDARYFGVAQRRRRVFIVGHLGDSLPAIQILFESEGVRWDPPTSQEAGPEVAHGLRASTGSRGTDDPDRSTYVVVGGAAEEAYQCHGSNVGPMGHLRAGNGDVTGGVPFVAESLARCDTTGERYDYETETFVPVAFSHTQGLDIQPSTSDRPTLRVGGGGAAIALGVALRGREGGSTAELGDETAFALRASQGGGDKPLVLAVSENQRAEVLLTDYNHQLTTGGGKPGQGYAAALVDHAVRKLTPVECERLQGFPDGWTKLFADSVRYKMLGNAVCVPVVRWIADRIVAMDACLQEEAA